MNKQVAVGMANNRFFCFTLILIFLLISHDEEARMVVVARTCESQSHHFKGTCLSDHNCGLVCKNEGFDNGWCRGFRHRCFCTRRCLHHPTSINATT